MFASKAPALDIGLCGCLWGAEGSQGQMEGHLHGVLPDVWDAQSVTGLSVTLLSGYLALGVLT